MSVMCMCVGERGLLLKTSLNSCRVYNNIKLLNTFYFFVCTFLLFFFCSTCTAVLLSVYSRCISPHEFQLLLWNSVCGFISWRWLQIRVFLVFFRHFTVPVHSALFKYDHSTRHFRVIIVYSCGGGLWFESWFVTSCCDYRVLVLSLVSWSKRWKSDLI